MSHLPIIDISPFIDPNRVQYKEKTIRELDLACKDHGFFAIVGHGVSDKICQNARDTAGSFFAQTTEQKKEICITKSGKLFRGYQSPGVNITQGHRDWHEGIDYYKEHAESHELVKNKTPLHGSNPWPSKPLNFKNVISQYIRTMLSLGEVVMEAIAMGLNLDRHFFKPFYNDSFWCLRILKYPSRNEAIAAGATQDELGCGIHSDYGCLTIINQDPTISGALSIQHKDGQWIEPDPIPGAFVMNIGDMLSRWTHGIYQSTPHRVFMTDRERISIPFFFEPSFNAQIQPIILDPTQNENCAPIMFGDHLQSKVFSNFAY